MTQSLAQVGGCTDPYPQVSSSATSYLSFSLPGSESLLPAARSIFSTNTPLYWNQLPPIPLFTGEESPETETFSDCLEQFDAMAQQAGLNMSNSLISQPT